MQNESRPGAEENVFVYSKKGLKKLEKALKTCNIENPVPFELTEELTLEYRNLCGFYIKNSVRIPKNTKGFLIEVPYEKNPAGFLPKWVNFIFIADTGEASGLFSRDNLTGNEDK